MLHKCPHALGDNSNPIDGHRWSIDTHQKKLRWPSMGLNGVSVRADFKFLSLGNFSMSEAAKRKKAFLKKSVSPSESSVVKPIQVSISVLFHFQVLACLQPPNAVDVNCRDGLGRTAIQIAADNENLELIEILLAQRDVHIGNALLCAIIEGVLPIVEKVRFLD